MTYDIFISYKRKSLATANNLYYRLTTRGYSTFFDLEEMRRDNFNEQIYNYIKNSKDVFILLEEGSLDACMTDDWKNDWFCTEIGYALKEGKNIIPILLNGYEMPDASFFPEELKELSYKNAPEFSFSFFDQYIDRLIKKGFITSKPQTNEGVSVFKFYSNADCTVTKEGKLVCSIEGNNATPYYLPVGRKGEYVFTVENSRTHKIKTIKSTIGSEEEKIIRINWRKPNLKIIGVLAALCIVTLLAFIFSSKCSKSNNSNDIISSDSVYFDGECTAQLYLMRYSELNTKYDNAFSEQLRDIFCYEDSNDDSQHNITHVFPSSKYYTFQDLDTHVLTNKLVLDSMPYHYPILRLKMNNKSKNTLVFNHLYIEVTDIKYDDNPVCGFSYDDNNITVVNQSMINIDCGFKYSLLRDGESFVNYRHQERLNFTDKTNLPSIKGAKLKGLFNEKYFIDPNPEGGDSNFNTQHQNYDIVAIPVAEGETEIHKYNNNKIGLCDEFNHSLRSGEPDDEVYFSISSSKPCECKVRLRIQSVDNKSLYTPYIIVKIFKPRVGYLYPNSL